MVRNLLLSDDFSLLEGDPAPTGLLASLAGTAGSTEIGTPVPHDGPAEAYNEDAFQYFLEIERRRAELSGRPFLMMLIDFKKHPTITPQIDAETSDKLFSVLSSCLRETDFLGWYREGYVAGAVLTQHGEPDENLARVVRHRIGGALRQSLPRELALRLQVRVYQIPPGVEVGSD